MTWFARVRFSVLALAIAGTAGSAIALTPVGPFTQSACAGDGPFHAALVVEHGNGSTIQRCVGFSSPTITGDKLLELSGIDYRTSGWPGLGNAVCQIDGEPTTFDVCFPSGKPYWAMFVSRGGGAWIVSMNGISSQTFSDGDAEGFRYQTGALPPPPSPTPCPSPTPVPTPTPISVATPRPAATPTPIATAAPRLAAGATPTRTPIASPTLAAGPASSVQSPSSLRSPSALAEAALVAAPTAPPAAPTDASATGDLTTQGAVFALLALVVVTIGAARTRARLQSS